MTRDFQSLHNNSDSTFWFMGAVLAVLIVLVAGWLAPIVLAWLLVAVVLIGVAALLFVLPNLIRKLVRENTVEGGVLSAWQPTASQAMMIVVKTLLSWLPFGVVSVLIFAANGLLVRILAELVQRGIAATIERTRDLRGTVDETAANVPLWFRMLPGDSAEVLSSLSSGVKSGEEVLGHLLAVLLFLLVLEGILGWIFLIWLTIRSVLYLLARRIVAQIAVTGAGTGAVTHFQMGFFR
jgi:hypothetical protein